MSLLFVRGRKPDNPDALRLLPAKLGVWASVRLLLRNRQAWFVALYSALIYTSIATLGAIWGTRVLIAKGLTQETAGDAISILWIGYTFGYLTGCDIPQIL
jgi:fucose permease